MNDEVTVLITEVYNLEGKTLYPTYRKTVGKEEIDNFGRYDCGEVPSFLRNKFPNEVWIYPILN